ncbi:MAG: hypothetical protein E7473_10505 [Ruminococcaceae bacterium]|nr:hypothetical protein [Oscillospiraceae bacterium]
MSRKKTKFIFIFTVMAVVLISVMLILREEDTEALPAQNAEDIISERIKSEIPISDIKISGDGKVFEINAKTPKEKIFVFLEEKLGDTGEKMRIFSSFMPDEIQFRCEVTLAAVEGEKGAKPTVTHMSLNEYEIPSSLLENIVDFPLISVGF